MRIPLAVAVAPLLALAGCFYGGACVEQAPADPRQDLCTEQWEYLYDSPEPDVECTGEYHALAHCRDLGFTEECTGGVYRRPGGC